MKTTHYASVTLAVLVCISPGKALAVSWTTIDHPLGVNVIVPDISGNTIVGRYLDPANPNISHGFKYDGSSYTTIDHPLTSTWTAPSGISGSNIVGTYTPSGSIEGRGFVFDGSTYTTLDPPTTGNGGNLAMGISGSNVVGIFQPSDGVTRGYLYDGSTYTTLNYPSAIGTWALGISGSKIVGAYGGPNGLRDGDGFVFDGTTWTTIKVGQRGTSVWGISGNSITGNYYDSRDVSHGFFFDGVVVTTLDYPLAVSTFVFGMDGNRVVGRYVDSSGAGHGFIATIPEPTSFALAALGLIGLVVWRRRLIRPQILSLFALYLVPLGSAHAATIGDLAAEVSASNLESHVIALQGDRESVDGRNAARSYIQGQLQGYGYTTSVDASGNVVAELTGTTTPGEIYVVGAHFDAFDVYPGADDNASGVAGMLEMARIFSTRSFDSTVRFIGFDQEEIGLVGSTAYAQNAATAGDNIALATIFEMIGYTGPTQTLLPTGDAGPLGSFAVSEDRTVGDFIGALAANEAQLLADYVNAAGLYAPSLPVVTGLFSADVTNPTTRNLFHNLYRSDHVGFWFNGYDALLLTDTANFRNPNYHTPNDVSSTLDYPFMTQVVQSTVGLVADRAGLVIVPEPSSFVLAALGLIGLVVWKRRKQ